MKKSKCKVNDVSEKEKQAEQWNEVKSNFQLILVRLTVFIASIVVASIDRQLTQFE